MPSTTSSVRQSQCGCIGAITAAQSPKLVTPEKKKYPVAPRRLNARPVSRKYRSWIVALFAARSANHRIIPNAKFTSGPPTATSRESAALDHATVESTPVCAPVRRSTAPWPSPSCKTFARIAEFRLIAQTVSRSSWGDTEVAEVVAGILAPPNYTVQAPLYSKVCATTLLLAFE